MDVVCPNETEAEVLTGIEVNNEADAARAAKRLRQLGAREAIITLGEKGALVCDETVPVNWWNHAESMPFDTTASGDAFAAALGLRIAEGETLLNSVRIRLCRRRCRRLPRRCSARHANPQ